jgi:plastocyanin
MTVRFSIGLALAGTIALSGCLDETTTRPDEYNQCYEKYMGNITVRNPPPNTIFVGDNCFRPGELVIKNGTTVTFINDGNSQHSPIIQPWGTQGLYKAPNGTRNAIEWETDLRPERPNRPAETAEHRFSHVGHFQVWCVYHGKMIDGEARDMAMPNGIRVVE